MHRISELADGEPGVSSAHRIPFKNLISLNEIAGEALGKSGDCQAAWDVFFRFSREFGGEQAVLTEAPLNDLRRLPPESVSRGIELMRQGLVKITPGHDGGYGRIRLYEAEPAGDHSGGQLTLF